MSGRCVGKASLLHEFGISPATLKRDLAHLRGRMNTPVVWGREARGYRLTRDQPVIGTQYELPGLWFSAEEIHARLTMQHLLAHLDAGSLLAPHIAPIPWVRAACTCRTSRPWAPRCCAGGAW